MKTVALLALALSACSLDSDDPEWSYGEVYPREPQTCTLAGQYELGMIPRIDGCLRSSEQGVYSGDDSSCYTRDNYLIATDGSVRTYYMVCGTGNPVVECEGFAYDSDGCEWDLYMRRIAD